MRYDGGVTQKVGSFFWCEIMRDRIGFLKQLPPSRHILPWGLV